MKLLRYLFKGPPPASSWVDNEFTAWVDLWIVVLAVIGVTVFVVVVT